MAFICDDFFADPDASVEIKPKLWQGGGLIDVSNPGQTQALPWSARSDQDGFRCLRD